jgi:hypothetical protein
MVQFTLTLVSLRNLGHTRSKSDSEICNKNSTLHSSHRLPFIITQFGIFSSLYDILQQDVDLLPIAQKRVKEAEE